MDAFDVFDAEPARDSDSFDIFDTARQPLAAAPSTKRKVDETQCESLLPRADVHPHFLCAAGLWPAAASAAATEMSDGWAAGLRAYLNERVEPTSKSLQCAV